MDSKFFDEVREQSRIKTRIVAKYFWAWAKVISNARGGGGHRLAYMDLFAGPGEYSDGTPSTPIIVLQSAIKDPSLCERLVTFFNDKDAHNARSLEERIQKIKGIETLKYRPVVKNFEVGQQIVHSLQSLQLIPTFLFVDPWGYKGLSLDLVNSVLRNWGCDCVFFFNYNRINPGLSNEVVSQHMNDLFGSDRANVIREKLVGLQSDEREEVIIDEFSLALREAGSRYVLPFAFKNEEGTRTKHHLIFITKNFKGYEIMKEIMAKESSEQDQGVGSFVYSPSSFKSPKLFEFTQPLDELEAMLLRDFAGRTLSMGKIYEAHNVGKPYIKSNYKNALLNLESTGKVSVDPPSTERTQLKGRRTFADRVMVTFPKEQT